MLVEVKVKPLKKGPLYMELNMVSREDLTTYEDNVGIFQKKQHRNM